MTTNLERDLDNFWYLRYIQGDSKIQVESSFCEKYKKVAPRLCQWIMENDLNPLDLDECKALFADEIAYANKLYERDIRKK